jgi:hypothetical protein
MFHIIYTCLCSVLSPKPVAKFSAAPLNACASQEINFTDQSTGMLMHGYGLLEMDLLAPHKTLFIIIWILDILM